MQINKEKPKLSKQ